MPPRRQTMSLINGKAVQPALGAELGKDGTSEALRFQEFGGAVKESYGYEGLLIVAVVSSVRSSFIHVIVAVTIAIDVQSPHHVGLGGGTPAAAETRRSHDTLFVKIGHLIDHECNQGTYHNRHGRRLW